MITLRNLKRPTRSRSRPPSFLQSKIVLIFVLAAPFFASAKELANGIAVVVNNETILESDLKDFQGKIDKNQLIDENLLFGEPESALKGKVKDQLDFLISEKLLDSEVKRLNMSVTVEKVDQELRDVAKRAGLSKNEFIAALKNQGYVLSEYQDYLRNRLQRKQLLEQEVIGKIRITDEELQAEYQKTHPGASTNASEYTLAQIFFNPKKGGWDRAYDRAKNVLSKLQSGDPFDTLALRYSEDPNVANDKGVLGTYKSGEFLPEFEAAVSPLTPPATSSIVRSKNGFYILKLVSKASVTDTKFEKEKERLTNNIYETNFKRQLRQWLDRLREDSFVRINHPIV